MINKLFSVWKGVYSSFVDAGGDLDAFDSNMWIGNNLDKVQVYLNNYKNQSAISKEYPLNLVVAMLLQKKERVRILDYGGGMGIQYLDLISKVPDSINYVDYFIVDGEKIIGSIPDDLKKFPKLRFCTTLSTITDKFDVIHIGSTLQYIEDWKKLTKFMVENYSPDFFVFSDLPAGNIKNFVSHQIFYEKNIPCLFFNLDEFRIFFYKDLQMKIMYESKFVSEILGQDEIYPNFDLPKELQIERAVNLVFFNNV